MRRCTRIRESTPLNKHNVHAFLRRFAKKISLDDLELIPKGGSSFTFYYGNDKILKVNKANARPSLVKEAKLAEYLSRQQLPFDFAKLLEVHPDGYYAIFQRLDAGPLKPETIRGFKSDELASFARSLGAFLSYIHGHRFPDDVLSHIPRPSEDLGLA
jgi:hypothetical protein